MIATLSAGAIGVSAPDLDSAISNAQRAGFPGLEFSVEAVADAIDSLGLDAVKAKFETAGVLPTTFGPPDFRGSEDSWKEGIAQLPRLAKAAQALGVTSSATWIMPCSNDRAFDANLRFHIERIKPLADILGEHGIRFGLEFVGPKTLRDSQKYPFVHTMEAMLDMGEKIAPNVGLLLDSFHWHTSHGTVAELLNVPVNRIVYVHLNDGIEGRTPDEQIDGQRDLPGATGVIDLAAFIGALNKLGFAGPAAVEPFKSSLKDLADDDARMAVVKKSLDATLALG